MFTLPGLGHNYSRKLTLVLAVALVLICGFMVRWIPLASTYARATSPPGNQHTQQSPKSSNEKVAVGPKASSAQAAGSQQESSKQLQNSVNGLNADVQALHRTVGNLQAQLDELRKRTASSAPDGTGS